MESLKAIFNYLRGKDRDMAKAMTDHVKNSELAIEDTKKMIVDYTSKVADLIGERKRRERERDAAKAKVAEWMRYAEAAAKNNDEASVRTAVKQKADAEALANTLDSEVQRDLALEQQLRTELDRMRAKVADAESDLTRLAARQQGAKIREQLAKTRMNDGTGALAALDDLKEVVEREECRSEAMQELAVDPVTSEAEAVKEKYNMGSANVEDEVSRLMAAARTTTEAPSQPVTP